MKVGAIGFLLILVLSTFTSDQSDFPIPVGRDNMLFYIQRTINKNTLIYELNLTEKNSVNVVEPIKTYWVNYATDGKEEPLNFVQRKYAYGLEYSIIDIGKQTFAFNFVSYKKQQLYLIKHEKTHRFGVYTKINKTTVKVNRIYVHIEGGSFWFPKVTYILLSGINNATGEPITEKIIPVRES